MMKFTCEFTKFKTLNFIFSRFHGKLLLNISLALRKCKRDFKILKIVWYQIFFHKTEIARKKNKVTSSIDVFYRISCFGVK